MLTTTLPEWIVDAPDWARRLWVFLRCESGYTACAARAIVLHVVRHGDLSECPEIDPEDVVTASELIPAYVGELL